MALVTHQPQGLYVTFSSRHCTWSKGLKLKPCITKHHIVGRADWHHLLKHSICLSVGPPHICRFKRKPLKLSAFKGSVQNNESAGRANGLKVHKTSVRLEESGEYKSESPKVHNVPLSYASDANESLTTSPAIHFKRWLTMLRTQPSGQETHGILGEPPPGVSKETLHGTPIKESGESFKVAWSNFLALDAMIKTPLLIFIPFYLAVNFIYGAEVSKELTPLWVLGPLIVAFYIMIIRSLCALYVFSFKQTVKVLKNLPSYCILFYSYIFHGKLKEDFQAHVFQPLLSVKNRNYGELTKRKLKELEEWIVEKYLDFVESIWPYYCRTIRFLKRANLI